jgi:hypothetical protein
MAMLLYERGLLDLDAPVGAVVPEFISDCCGKPDPRRRDVTLRMLLDALLRVYQPMRNYSSKTPTHDELASTPPSPLPLSPLIPALATNTATSDSSCSASALERHGRTNPSTASASAKSSAPLGMTQHHLQSATGPADWSLPQPTIPPTRTCADTRSAKVRKMSQHLPQKNYPGRSTRRKRFRSRRRRRPRWPVLHRRRPGPLRSRPAQRRPPHSPPRDRRPLHPPRIHAPTEHPAPSAGTHPQFPRNPEGILRPPQSYGHLGYTGNVAVDRSRPPTLDHAAIDQPHLARLRESSDQTNPPQIPRCDRRGPESRLRRSRVPRFERTRPQPCREAQMTAEL